MSRRLKFVFYGGKYMNVDTKIFNALNTRLGFETDPDDPPATYKGLVPGKISLYFVKARDGNGPQVGYWIKGEVNDTLRKNLTVEMNNVFLNSSYCNNPKTEYDEAGGGWWIWCDITAANESVVEWLVTAMEEVERRALFMINK
jgi:hypothetical protein